MPGVIQPQRPVGSLQNALTLGGMIMSAKNSFGGGSSPGGDSNVGSTDQAAQGAAVTPYQAPQVQDSSGYQTYNQNDPTELAPWAQRRVIRSY